MSQATDLGILALIPAYNEAEGIAGVVADASLYLPVVVVDDGSQDATPALAEASGARVIRQAPNQGKGAALIAGFRHAYSVGYEAVVMLDADGQHDPHEIPKFLAVYRERQADLIVGARDFSKMPVVRRMTNTFGRWSFSLALGHPDRDNQSGYRLLSQRMVGTMLASKEFGFEFEVEMIVMCVKRGYRLDWVPIKTIYAGEKSHIKPVQHVINWFRILRKTRQMMREG